MWRTVDCSQRALTIKGGEWAREFAELDGGSDEFAGDHAQRPERLLHWKTRPAKTKKRGGKCPGKN